MQCSKTNVIEASMDTSQGEEEVKNNFRMGDTRDVGNGVGET